MHGGGKRGILKFGAEKINKRGANLDYGVLLKKPKTKRGRHTLNRLVSAAAQVFYEKGYHNATINDITQRAGVSAGAFYVYFDSKYNLYKCLLLQCSHMIRKHLNQAVQDCKTRQEVEEVGLRVWLEFVRQNRYMYHIIWESLYIDKQLFVDYYVNFSKAYMRGIDAAKAKGEIRPEIDSEVLAYTLMGASNFLGLNWGLFKNYPTDFEQVVTSFMYIIDGGIFTGNKTNISDPDPLPIRIQVEFDDDEDLDEDEDEDEDEEAEDGAEADISGTAQHEIDDSKE